MANDNLILDDNQIQQCIDKANKGDCQSIESLIWHFSSIGDKNNEKKWENIFAEKDCKNKLINKKHNN